MISVKIEFLKYLMNVSTVSRLIHKCIRYLALIFFPFSNKINKSLI